jgi:hypothetical protein
VIILEWFSAGECRQPAVIKSRLVDDVNRFTELNENNNSLEKELSVAPAGQPVPPAQKDELIQQLQLQIQELMKQLIGLMSQLVELLQKQLKSQ